MCVGSVASVLAWNAQSAPDENELGFPARHMCMTVKDACGAMTPDCVGFEIDEVWLLLTYSLTVNKTSAINIKCQKIIK